MTSSCLRIFRLALCALAAATVAASANSFQFAAPPKALLRHYTKPIRFGYLTVPENRARPNGRFIRIAVVILKAVHPAPGAPPVFFLNGGPGGSPTAFGELFPVFGAIQQSRDVVLIDQRGVGFSQPYLGFDAADNRDIRTARNAFHARGIDLSAYNTTENAADIEDLRIALGHPQVIIFGNSYGTILAQQFLRAYPGGVAACIINGVNPAEVDFIEVYNRSTRHGLAELFRDIQRNGPARRAFPQFRLTYFKLLRRLQKRPIRIGEFVVTSASLQGRVLGYLQTPQRIRLIPFLVTRIAEGKLTPWLIKQLTPASPAIPRGISGGMYNSVVGTAYHSPGWAARIRKVNASLNPEIFRRSNSAATGEIVRGVDIWGVPYNPLATRDPLFTSIPTLVLDGQMEAQTPFDGGATVASRLPRSILLTFPRSGHGTGFTAGPAMQAILQFIANPTRRPVYSLASLRRNDFYLTPRLNEAGRRAGMRRTEPDETPYFPLP